MEEMSGVLKLRVVKGKNLVVKDISASDPYVVIKMGNQKLKTNVANDTVNPEWHEDLTLVVAQSAHPIKIEVYDKDRFNRDDEMGRAELEVSPFMEAARLLFAGAAAVSVERKIQPDRSNCLAEESRIYVAEGGELIQDAILRLRDVKSGEVQIRLQWVDLPTTFP